MRSRAGALAETPALRFRDRPGSFAPHCGVFIMTDRPDIYASITARIVEALEAGVIPWRSPILRTASGLSARNLVSNRPYSGCNAFLLAFTAHCNGYASPYWVTFRQALAAGGSVRKGEKGTHIVYWRMLDIEKADGEKKSVPMLRHFVVFNIDQCDGIADPSAVPVQPERPFSPIESAARIVAGFAGAPDITHAGCRAYYTPSADTVTIPEPTGFRSPEAYYATLFHELAHATGHAKRLGRGLGGAQFGSPEYAREELIAEMGAAFLCAEAGISPATVEDSAAYIASWLKALRNDRKLVVVAAGAAQKAANHILGVVAEPIAAAAD